MKRDRFPDDIIDRSKVFIERPSEFLCKPRVLSFAVVPLGAAGCLSTRVGGVRMLGVSVEVSQAGAAL